MNHHRPKPQDIYDYWFDPKRNILDWFKMGKKYDKEIRRLFAPILIQAEQNKLDHWPKTHNKVGFVSLILLLDQFSRHVYRGQGDIPYKNDKKAVKVLIQYIHLYFDELSPKELLFVLLPLQHSLNVEYQLLGLAMLDQLIKKFTDIQHKDLILLETALEHQKGHYNILRNYRRFPKRLRPSKRTENEKKYVESTPHLPY